MDAGQLRKQTQLCQREIGDLLRVLKQRRPMVRGNLYNLRRKCGKAGCRCQDGYLHESCMRACGSCRATSMKVRFYGKWLMSSSP